MDVLDILRRERATVEKERAAACAPFDAKIAEFNAAIAAVENSRGKPPAVSSRAQAGSGAGKPTIDDAIVEAVKNDRRAPVAILKFLSDNMGIETTLNSVRARVSRLKNQGRLAHDGHGWILPEEASAGLPFGPETETAPPPWEGGTAT